MSQEDAYDTAAIETLEEEIPDRLRSLIEEHHPNIRQILIQQKKDATWRVIKKRIKGVSGLELDYVCQEVVRIVRNHAEGSESDRLYRAKLDIHASDGTTFARTATIRARVGGDGELDIDDSSEQEERTHLTLLRDVMDANQARESAMFDKAMDCLSQAQEQARLNVTACTSVMHEVAEAVKGYNQVGEGMNGLLVGVTGMIATGVELHSSHAQSQAEVQIKQMEFDHESAKWAGALGILGKVAAPLGGQIAASFKKKKGSVTQAEPAAVAGEVANVPATIPADGEPPEVVVVTPPDGWEKGMAAKVRAVMASLDDDHRKAITETMGPSTLGSFDDAGKSDEEASTYLPVIRAGIEQRLQQNEYAQRMLMAKLSGALGDERTAKLFDLLPPAPEE